MYDFGFLPESLPGLALVEGYDHKIGDIYDPTATNLGNSYLSKCDENNRVVTVDPNMSSAIPDWLYLKNLHTDLRMFYVKCVNNKLTPYHEWGECHVK
jgi:hypothetical protein